MNSVTKAEMVEKLELDVSVLFNDPDAKPRALDVYRSILAAIKERPEDADGGLLKASNYRAWEVGRSGDVFEKVITADSAMDWSRRGVKFYSTRQAAEEAAKGATAISKRVNEISYGDIAGSHPKLARGIVWCKECGRSQRVDSGKCLQTGWPECCGYTMSIDSPEERARYEATDD